MLARKLLMVSIGGGAFVVPSFTGSYAVFGDEKKGYIELYSSGTLTFTTEAVVDVFVLPSGLKGATAPSTSSYSGGANATGGSGGKGGKGETGKAITVKGDYSVTVGASCSSTSTVNSSSALGIMAASVNSTGVGTGGKAGCTFTYDSHNNQFSNITSETAATAGQAGISYPFGELPVNSDILEMDTESESLWIKLNLGATGGGGGAATSASSGTKTGANGGAHGAGNGGNASRNSVANGNPGTSNTGSGGGGGSACASWNNWNNSDHSKKGVNGNGGSGIVIVRWGDWSDAA